MTIREYFEAMWEGQGADVAMDAELELWNAMQDEDFDVELWAMEHNVDLDAMGAHGITVFQYWCWDQEE